MTMARSSIQRRQEAERARGEAFDASLRRVSQQERTAPDFQKAIKDVKRGFETELVRDAAAWRPQMKTRDAARLRLAAARYLFALYPVADHLEQIWLGGGVELSTEETRLRKRWYVVAAGGRSLFSAGADAWLSRREVHAFLNPPCKLNFEQAVWQAIARSYTSDAGVALRIARSRLAQWPATELAFWREVVRFFCVYPTPVGEMEDFADYLAHCRQQDRGYTLKGRTIGSLARQMREWHRDLAMVQRIEAARRRADEARARARGHALAPEASAGGSWTGSPLADWSWSPASKDRSKREAFLVVQLRTADELMAETRAMHHCVATYATKCIAGYASIWSLRRRSGTDTQRLLTVEVDRQHRAVQIRGFANRLAHAEEVKLLERWAKARGIVLP